MKAIISNRLWLPKDCESATMTDACSHKIPLSEYEAMLSARRGGLPYRVIKTYTRPTSTVISLPSGRADLIPDGMEIVDKTVFPVLDTFPIFSGNLRESQRNAVDFAQRYGNIIICARPGWGKTFTACAIAAMHKTKVLIVVHTKALMEQWINEIKKVLGTESGKIGDDSYTIGEYITVGIIKSLHKHRMRISKEFGLVIVDEVHHLPAEQFLEFINSSYAKVKIGMSGTLERTDKTHVVIYDYISTMVFHAPDENVMTPEVHVINLPINFTYDYHGCHAFKVSALNSDPRYTTAIAEICKVYALKGHKILCVMERVDAIQVIADKADAVPYHYNTSKEAKAKAFSIIKSGEKNTLVGSVKIFSEGISENYLSCLVLGLQTKGPPLEQLIGRVIRENPGKQQPVIVDIRLQGKSPAKAAGERDAYYTSVGYKVTVFN